MIFYALTGLINAVGSSILGLLYTKNRKSKINQTFALFCLSAAIWSYSYYFWQTANDINWALFFWLRFLMAGAIFIPIFYLHFILVFLDKVSQNRKLLIFCYLASLLSNEKQPSDVN